MFDNNFGKCRLIFKILSVYTAKISSLYAILVKVENPKRFADFDSILNKLVTCS